MKVIKQQVKKLIVWGLRRYVKVVYMLEKRGGGKTQNVKNGRYYKKRCLWGIGLKIAVCLFFKIGGG